MIRATIREATTDDVDAIVSLGIRITNESADQTGTIADAEQIRSTAVSLIDSADRAVVLVAERDATLVGMCGLLRYQHPLSGVVAVSEVCWWVNPEARGGRVGVDLLRAAEAWATAHGAARVQFVASTKRLAKHLLTQGYRASDTIYERSLPCLS